jgi:histidyl-tRNA synthetase
VLGEEEVTSGQGTIRKMADGSEEMILLDAIGTYLKENKEGKP